MWKIMSVILMIHFVSFTVENMDVPKAIFFLLISLIPMSDSVESRVRVPQRGNKQNEIILKVVGLEGNCLVLSLPERRESKVTWWAIEEAGEVSQVILMELALAVVD